MIHVHCIYWTLYFYCYYSSFTLDHQALDLRGWGLLTQNTRLLNLDTVLDTSSGAGNDATTTVYNLWSGGVERVSQVPQLKDAAGSRG